jgi:hypothetical protein
MITVAVIDHADDGFNLSEEAMNTLTCVGSFLVILLSRIRLLTRTVATAKPGP